MTMSPPKVRGAVRNEYEDKDYRPASWADPVSEARDTRSKPKVRVKAGSSKPK